MKVLLAVSSVLLSTAFLLMGHGMQLTLLPLRADGLGMPEFLVGISASFYFAGFIAGCMTVPRVIIRVGHIRSFSVLAAIMIIALLSLEVLDYWPIWLFLRFMTGLAVSSLYAIIESWLNSQASAATRGRILAVYTFITLAAMASGQLWINVGPVMTSTPFILAAIFMALSILPVGLTRGMAPSPPESTRVRFGMLYQRSHSAFSGAVFSGLVTGSFWALGALFASNYSTGQNQVTWFITTAMVGGALFQYPIGWFSDKVDRRLVLLVLSVGVALSSTAVALSVQKSWFLATVFLFGATALPVYGVALATAADVTEDSEFVEVGTSVLMLNAAGAALAPLILGPLMTYLGATSLYWAFASLAVLFTLVFYLLSRDPRSVPIAEQTPFSAVAVDVAPGSFELDPRSEHPADTLAQDHREKTG